MGYWLIVFHTFMTIFNIRIYKTSPKRLATLHVLCGGMSMPSKAYARLVMLVVIVVARRGDIRTCSRTD